MFRFISKFVLGSALLLVFISSFVGLLFARHVYAWIDKPETIEGTITSLVEDNFVDNTSRERRYIQVEDGSAVEIKTDSQFDIPSGTRVRAKGVKTGEGKFDVMGMDGSVEVVTSADLGQSTFTGTKRAAVILVNFNDLNTSQPTRIFAKNEIDVRLNSYIKEVSFNKLRYANTEVYGWYEMNIPTTCSGETIVTNAVKSADPHLNYNEFDQVLIVFPNSNCPYGAFAYYPPGKRITTNEGTLNKLISVYPHNYFLDQGWHHVIPHEFGHNFGARHAGGLECGQLSYSAACFDLAGDGMANSIVEYGDVLDIMGGSYSFISTFGSYEKELFGWINPLTNTKIVNTSGRYKIAPISKNSTAFQQLKIPRLGSSKYYIIENRVNHGFDSYLPSTAYEGGQIKIAPSTITEPDRTLILDSIPHVNPNIFESNKDFWDATYQYGKTFTDYGRGIRITPLSKDLDQNLEVEVEYYAPQQLLPSNEEEHSKELPTFDWKDLPARASYSFQLAKGSPGNIILNTNVAESTFALTSPLTKGSAYYWRVRANYIFGSLQFQSDWSPNWSFRVSNPPSTPLLVSPANGQILTINRPDLVWSQSTNSPAYYQVQIDTANTFNTQEKINVKVVALNTNFRLENPLQQGKAYYWRVRAFNSEGDWSAWSQVRSFVIHQSVKIGI